MRHEDLMKWIEANNYELIEQLNGDFCLFRVGDYSNVVATFWREGGTWKHQVFDHSGGKKCQNS